MDNRAVERYRKLREQIPQLQGPWREKAEQDLEVVKAIILEQHPGFVFEVEDTHQAEAAELAKAIKAAQERLEKADAYFAHHQGSCGPFCALCKKQTARVTSGAAWDKAVTLADDIARELGELTGRASALRLYWNGDRLVLLDGDLTENAARLFEGRTVTPLSAKKVGA